METSIEEEEFLFASPDPVPSSPAHETMETRRSKQFQILASLLLSFITIFLLRVFFSAWIVTMTFNICVPYIMDSLGIKNNNHYKPFPYHAAVMVVIMIFVLFPTKA